jgi:hypothetical protein
VESIFAYLVAGALLGVSVVLIKGGSPFAPVGPGEYVERQKRRAAGHVFWVLAVLVLVVGLVNQFVSATPRDLPAETSQGPR